MKREKKESTHKITKFLAEEEEEEEEVEEENTPVTNKWKTISTHVSIC